MKRRFKNFVVTNEQSVNDKTAEKRFVVKKEAVAARTI